MFESNGPAESSLLLLLLATLVAVLTSYVTLGWLHGGRRAGVPAGTRWRAMAVAAMVLSSGLCGTAVLVLAAEALSFRIGYHLVGALALWLGGMAGCAVVATALLHSRRWWALAGSGALLGAVALALQIGWIDAAGFRPGVQWEPMFIAAAGALLVVGCTCGVWLAWSDGSEGGHRHVNNWRLGAALLIGLSLITGQEVLSAGIGMQAQVGSVYTRQLPSTVLSLLGGVLLPLLLVVMAAELATRRRRRRSVGDPYGGFEPRKRRKRRHKIRTI